MVCTETRIRFAKFRLVSVGFSQTSTGFGKLPSAIFRADFSQFREISINMFCVT